MTDTPDYLFVYGTLRPPFNNPFAHYLRRWGQYVGEGSFRGRLYDLNHYPGAIYENHQNSMVYGTVYNISNHRDKILAYLDEYEGMSNVPAELAEYARAIVPARCADRVLHCWVYVYNLDPTGKRLIESGDYVSYSDNK